MRRTVNVGGSEQPVEDVGRLSLDHNSLGLDPKRTDHRPPETTLDRQD